MVPLIVKSIINVFNLKTFECNKKSILQKDIVKDIFFWLHSTLLASCGAIKKRKGFFKEGGYDYQSQHF